MAPIMLRTPLVSTLSLASAALLALGAGGCGGSEDEGETLVSSAITAENALTANALTANALTANALTANALTANALTANALTANALTANGLKDPLAREFLKYAVSCALPEGTEVSMKLDGVRYSFPGSLGLAPEWGKKNGSCDGSCQRWVSGCMLARVDAAGVKRDISIRGANPGLLPEKGELRAYPEREATYFGNLFIKGQPRFLCLSPDQTSNERVCGDSMTSCPMTVVGACQDACVFEGLFGGFQLCSDAGKAWHGTTYLESVTVFLPR
jgi:hypothetical protein